MTSFTMLQRPRLEFIARPHPSTLETPHITPHTRSLRIHRITPFGTPHRPITTPVQREPQGRRSALDAVCTIRTIGRPTVRQSRLAGQIETSLLNGKTDLSCASRMAQQSVYSSTLEDAPFPRGPLTTPSMSAPSVITLSTERRDVLETDFCRVVTPYDADEWALALHRCNLTTKYPNLVHDIRFGAPIGDPPPLSYTFIPSNMPSANDHPEVVDEYLAEECAAGRISGPYSREEASTLFHGHFRTAPMGVIEKEPGDGKWRIIRNLSAKDSRGVSTNSWLNADDEPIMWHSCSKMADIVSLL